MHALMVHANKNQAQICKIADIILSPEIAYWFTSAKHLANLLRGDAAVHTIAPALMGAAYLLHLGAFGLRLVLRMVVRNQAPFTHTTEDDVK